MNLGAWVLIIFAHVGPMGDGNSNALTVAYFNTPQACAVAGTSAQKLSQGSTKKIEFVCVPRG